LRLRYEIGRKFAPYIGVAYEKAFGGTARLLSAAGEKTDRLRFAIGLRSWF
jgi:copper resistance protein B